MIMISNKENNVNLRHNLVDYTFSRGQARLEHAVDKHETHHNTRLDEDSRGSQAIRVYLVFREIAYFP